MRAARRVAVYDTTLRDGAQGAEIADVLFRERLRRSAPEAEEAGVRS